MKDFSRLSLASGIYWLKKVTYEKSSSSLSANIFELIMLPYSLIVGQYNIEKKKRLREKIIKNSSHKEVSIALVTIAKMNQRT